MIRRLCDQRFLGRLTTHGGFVVLILLFSSLNVGEQIQTIPHIKASIGTTIGQQKAKAAMPPQYPASLPRS